MAGLKFGAPDSGWARKRALRERREGRVLRIVAWPILPSLAEFDHCVPISPPTSSKPNLDSVLADIGPYSTKLCLLGRPRQHRAEFEQNWAEHDQDLVEFERT